MKEPREFARDISFMDNGHVTLEGVVRTELEKAVAGLRASEVGLESGPVENNLHVENPSHKS